MYLGGRDVTTARRWILWALLVGVLPSCGGRTSGETCLAVTVTYTGSKSGAAYYVIRFEDGGHDSASAPSIQVMMALNGFAHCAVRLTGGDIPFTAAAWIDVSGDSPANCADMSTPRCQPSPADPQAQQSGVERFRQTTQVRLDLVDPP